MEIEPIQSASVPKFALGGKPVHGSSAVLVRGEFGLLYTSGLVAAPTKEGRGEIEAQVRSVLDQLRDLVQQAGGEMSNVVKLIAWLPRREDIATYAELRRDYFPDHAPASTSLVCELVEPDLLIEVEAVVAIPAERV